MACLIAYHGWGFDHCCWAEWQAHFQPKKHQFHCFDRGYFGPPQAPQFAGDRPYILLLHSFGLYLCSVKSLSIADTVIIFNSFLHFHPAEPRLQRRSRLTLQRMGDRLRTNPRDVLHTFWQNCEVPQQWPHPSMVNPNYSLLQQDLTQLNDANLTVQAPLVQALRLVPTIWVVHSETDKIVPVTQGATLADAVATSNWINLPVAGHALPFSHANQCWTLPPFTAL